MAESELTVAAEDWQNQLFGPDGSSRHCPEVRVDITLFGTSQKLAAYCLDGSEWRSLSVFDAFDFDPDALVSAKLASYIKGRGASVFVQVTLRQDADPVIAAKFDEEVVSSHALAAKASAAQLMAELTRFPRTEDNIPDWMVQTIEAAGEAVPVLDPETDMVVVGHESWPYKEPSR
jgi:hypothetical protein